MIYKESILNFFKGVKTIISFSAVLDGKVRHLQKFTALLFLHILHFRRKIKQ